MKSPDTLRREAKTLRKAYEAGGEAAIQRVRSVRPRSDDTDLKHADYLHIVAREVGFSSWPALVASVELRGLDRAEQVQRLMSATGEGQDVVVRQLLSEDPSLGRETLSLAASLYDLEGMTGLLDGGADIHAKQGRATPFLHFCRSRMLRLFPEREGDMLAIADLFASHGIDVNAGLPVEDGAPHILSPLYFALGHAGNMPLARWLLAAGADPNDGESLYHATELGHSDGVKLLLAHGAKPAGTNALPRAMDFDDADMVRLLLDAGADPNEFAPGDVGGDAPFVVPALHQAARRMSSPPVVEALFAAGSDVNRLWQGKSAYAFASVYGNQALAERLASAGADTTLTQEEALMAKAARGEAVSGEALDPAKLHDDFRNILRNIVHLPGSLPRIRAFVEIGVEYDRPDPVEGLTPVQVAGWEGLPEALDYLLDLRPDLSHVNDYGGTLFSTILHGSENNPSRDGRDYIGCLRRVLHEGVALPRRALTAAGSAEIRDFLTDWAEAHPGQVVEHGVA